MNSFNKNEIEQQIPSTSFINNSKSMKESDQFDLVYNKKLQSPILDQNCQPPDFLTSYMTPIILDDTLSYIPVYTNLKIYDLKPVQRPKIPSILLNSQLSKDIRKSPKEVSSDIINEENRVHFA